MNCFSSCNLSCIMSLILGGKFGLGVVIPSVSFSDSQVVTKCYYVFGCAFFCVIGCWIIWQFSMSLMMCLVSSLRLFCLFFVSYDDIFGILEGWTVVVLGSFFAVVCLDIGCEEDDCLSCSFVTFSDFCCCWGSLLSETSLFVLLVYSSPLGFCSILYL